MGACAHGANYKGCPDQKVAEEFSHKPAGGYSKKAVAALSPKAWQREKAKAGIKA